MLKNRFDPTKKLGYVLYGRMSTDKQNPRSPDQQFDTVRNELKRLGYPWREVAVYRDQGVSGKRTDRPGFSKMLDDIKSKRIVVDAILVDNWDRFGRNSETPHILSKLLNNSGVVMLTADSGFSDPNSPVGQAHGFVQQMRSVTENEAKARSVRRGKLDAVLRKHWPGGTPPYGYQLETQFRMENGRQVTDHSILVPNPAKARVVQMAFDKATAEGWGATRVAEFLNLHPEIDSSLKPFNASTVGTMLNNPLYIGRYVWDKKETDIVENRRVSKSRPVEELTVVEGFCAPLVDTGVWKLFQQQFTMRSTLQNKKKKDFDEKAIAPWRPECRSNIPSLA